MDKLLFTQKVDTCICWSTLHSQFSLLKIVNDFFQSKNFVLSKQEESYDLVWSLVRIWKPPHTLAYLSFLHFSLHWRLHFHIHNFAPSSQRLFAVYKIALFVLPQLVYVKESMFSFLIEARLLLIIILWKSVLFSWLRKHFQSELRLLKVKLWVFLLGDFKFTIYNKINAVNAILTLFKDILAPFELSKIHPLVHFFDHVTPYVLEKSKTSEKRHNLFQFSPFFLADGPDVIFASKSCKNAILWANHRSSSPLIGKKSQFTKTESFRNSGDNFEQHNGECWDLLRI